jgi:hypothetical protein
MEAPGRPGDQEWRGLPLRQKAESYSRGNRALTATEKLLTHARANNNAPQAAMGVRSCPLSHRVVVTVSPILDVD